MCVEAEQSSIRIEASAVERLLSQPLLSSGKGQASRTSDTEDVDQATSPNPNPASVLATAPGTVSPQEGSEVMGIDRNQSAPTRLSALLRPLRRMDDEIL